MIASSMQESGLDGKTAWDMQASSIDKENEPNTNSLDNFGGTMEETTSNILDSKLSQDAVARNLLESNIKMAGKDSKDGVNTIVFNLLATVTSLENQIKIMGDNIKTRLDIGGLTAKEGELQSTGDMLCSSWDPLRKYNQGSLDIIANKIELSVTAPQTQLSNTGDLLTSSKAAEGNTAGLGLAASKILNSGKALGEELHNTGSNPGRGTDTGHAKLTTAISGSKVARDNMDHSINTHGEMVKGGIETTEESIEITGDLFGEKNLTSLKAVGDSVTSLDLNHKASQDGNAGKVENLKTKAKAPMANLGSSIDSGNHKLAESMGRARNSLGSISVNIKIAGETSENAVDFLTSPINIRMVTSLDTGETWVSTPTDPGLNLLSVNLLSRLAVLEKELRTTGSSVSPKRQTRRV